MDNKNKDMDDIGILEMIVIIFAVIVIITIWWIGKDVNVSWEENLIKMVEKNTIEYEKDGDTNDSSYTTLREFKFEVKKHFNEKFKDENGIKVFGNNDYIITSNDLEKYINNKISQVDEEKNYKIEINEKNSFELEGVKLKTKDFIEYVSPMFSSNNQSLYYKIILFTR